MKTHERYGLPGVRDEAYWEKVHVRAAELQSDGCSGPTLQVYKDACLEHDIHYRTHATLYGRAITREDADAIFFERIKAMSPLDGFSPMAHWRYAALRLFGGAAWEGEERGTPLAEHPTLYAWKRNCPDEAP